MYYYFTKDIPAPVEMPAEMPAMPTPLLSPLPPIPDA
jgi:hypothetical protein